jgi:hypothetical protein
VFSELFWHSRLLFPCYKSPLLANNTKCVSQCYQLWDQPVVVRSTILFFLTLVLLLPQLSPCCLCSHTSSETSSFLAKYSIHWHPCHSGFCSNFLDSIWFLFQQSTCTLFVMYSMWYNSSLRKKIILLSCFANIAMLDRGQTMLLPTCSLFGGFFVLRCIVLSSYFFSIAPI